MYVIYRVFALSYLYIYIYIYVLAGLSITCPILKRLRQSLFVSGEMNIQCPFRAPRRAKPSETLRHSSGALRRFDGSRASGCCFGELWKRGQNVNSSIFTV